MKRDCGKGELIPFVWKVLSCKGMDDRERCSIHKTEEEAIAAFDKRKVELSQIKFSNVRLYVGDKQGYLNCIDSWVEGV